MNGRETYCENVMAIKKLCVPGCNSFLSFVLFGIMNTLCDGELIMKKWSSWMLAHMAEHARSVMSSIWKRDRQIDIDVILTCFVFDICKEIMNS